ncbi:M23 family metallopeptidase [Shewanella sp. D64]|nr:MULTISPECIES: M23 family metallopeptidase [unclassified Shewanella]MEC4728300.1 M23 family metallopeptidase [Shewanella sp. D64]MEC4740373.1 M23 family metallopeptidase [Shewanella sp. E94]WBJ98192.1 M23 family metallopeptidase [Shewanella sp. MTB7]
MWCCLATTSLLVSQDALAQIELIGKMEQGALIRAQVEPGTEAFLNGDALKVSSQGKFAFGFAREAELTQELKLVYSDGLTQLMPLKINVKEYKIDRVNGISKKIMKPDPKAIERSREDSKQVRAARSQFSEQTAFSQNFIWPLTGRISGVYGSQRVYNGKPGNPHYGVDVAAKTGTVVVAPADGIISLSVSDMFYSGGTIILDHGFGVSSSFLHLSKLYVKEGESIKQGQPIAEVGATGRVTGPHLDWRVNWYQMRLDPVTIVPSMSSVLSQSK